MKCGRPRGHCPHRPETTRWQPPAPKSSPGCHSPFAITRYGSPDIFNTDQGSQFTSFAFTNTLKDAGISILNAFETGSEARTGIGRWIGYYNTNRPHSTFGGRTPDEVYATQADEEKLAA